VGACGRFLAALFAYPAGAPMTFDPKPGL